MCQTTGPKYFLPPNQLSSGGNFAAPVNYASSPQATADAGNLPAPPQPQPAPPVSGGPGVDPMSQLQKIFSGMFGGGRGGGMGGPVGRTMFQN